MGGQAPGRVDAVQDSRPPAGGYSPPAGLYHAEPARAGSACFAGSGPIVAPTARRRPLTDGQVASD